MGADSEKVYWCKRESAECWSDLVWLVALTEIWKSVLNLSRYLQLSNWDQWCLPMMCNSAWSQFQFNSNSSQRFINSILIPIPPYKIKSLKSDSDFNSNAQIGFAHHWLRSRGVVTRKMYTPARTAPRNPYPQLHKICENGTLPVLAYAYCLQWECPHGTEIRFTANDILPILLKSIGIYSICKGMY